MAQADPHIRGYYLSADVAHDFGPDVLQKSSYNYGGPTANAKLPGTPKIEEDAAVEFIEETAKTNRGNEFIENGKARRSKRIIFTKPTKTAAFSVSSVPILFGGGNDKIGIVQDAGSFITGFLGAKNVITFGSILDPAGKPISKDDAPIWYRPPDGSIATIPLGPFGFDTKKIEYITVSGLTAGLVSSTFKLGVEGKGKTYDAVTMKEYKNTATPLGKKPINNTKIETSGFYTSIAKAESATKSTSKGIEAPPGYLFNVGKTLGDAALVASAMPSFRSNDETTTSANPFYGIGTAKGKGGWYDWINGEPVQAPSILMLKTGDRLNALRAQMENVPNILEQQAGKGRTVKQYLFTPGQADPKAIESAVIQGYGNLKTNVAGRYDALIQNFNKCLLPNGSLNPLYTIFTETPTIQPKDTEGLVLAGTLIKMINDRLLALKEDVVEWLTERSQYNPKDLETFQTNYNSDVETCTRVAPQTTDVLYSKQGNIKVKLKIVVSQVPKVIPDGYTCPLKVSLDISLWNAFLKLQRNGGNKGLSAILGTDIYKRFLIPIESIVPMPNELKQRGGGVGISLAQPQAAEPEDLEEKQLLTEFVNYVNPSPKEGGMSGGDKPAVRVAYSELKSRYSTEDVFPNNEFAIEFPLVSQFHDYVTETLSVKELSNTLLAIYDISLNRGGNTTIVDDTFLNEFLKEVDYLTSEEDIVEGKKVKKVPLVQFSKGQEATKETTGGTAAFNAFTYYINQENANTFGFVDRIPETPDENTEATYEDGSIPSFKTLEDLFLEKAKKSMLHTRSQSYFGPVDIQQGGRRPLYAPRHKTYRRKHRSKKTRKQ